MKGSTFRLGKKSKVLYSVSSLAQIICRLLTCCQNKQIEWNKIMRNLLSKITDLKYDEFIVVQFTSFCSSASHYLSLLNNSRRQCINVLGCVLQISMSLGWRIISRSQSRCGKWNFSHYTGCESYCDAAKPDWAVHHQSLLQAKKFCRLKMKQ